MSPKEQARALVLLRRFMKYAEDWQAAEGTKPYYLPNGVKLREDVKDFVTLVDEDDEEPEEKPEPKGKKE